MSACHSLSLGELRPQASEIINASLAARKAAGLGDENDPWLLPDDGLVDQLAVRLAVQTGQQVKLTATERLEVATLALAYGATTEEALRAINLPYPPSPPPSEVRYLTPTDTKIPSQAQVSSPVITETPTKKREMNHGYDAPEPACRRPCQPEPPEQDAPS